MTRYGNSKGYMKKFLNLSKQLALLASLISGSPVVSAQSHSWLDCAGSIKQKLNAGDYAGAIRAIESCRSILKPTDDIQYLVFLNNAGFVYAEAGRIGESIETKNEALSLSERLYPMNHPEVVDAKLGLAVAYMYAGDATKAVPLLEMAWASADTATFPNARLSLRVIRTLASAYDMAGDPKKALPMAKRALIGAETQKLDALELAFFQQDLALILRKTGEVQQAIPLLISAYEARAARAPQGDYGVATAAHNLGISYLDRCDLEKAKQFLDQAYDWRFKNLGPTHVATLRTLEQKKLLESLRCVE